MLQSYYVLEQKIFFQTNFKKFWKKFFCFSTKNIFCSGTKIKKNNFFLIIALFSKKLISFFIVFFPQHVCKVFFPKPDVCKMSLQSKILQGMSSLCFLGTRSKPCGGFMAIFSLSTPNSTVQSFLRAKNSTPGRYILIIATPCCKYSKNNV